MFIGWGCKSDWMCWKSACWNLFSPRPPLKYHHQRCVCASINSWRFQNCQKVSHRSAEVGTSLQVLLRALLKGRGTSSLMPVWREAGSLPKISCNENYLAGSLWLAFCLFFCLSTYSTFGLLKQVCVTWFMFRWSGMFLEQTYLL